MKVRELVEIMERVREAKADIAEAKRRLGFGGAPRTVEHRESMLALRKRVYENLLDEDVPE